MWESGEDIQTMGRAARVLRMTGGVIPRQEHKVERSALLYLTRTEGVATLAARLETAAAVGVASRLPKAMVFPALSRYAVEVTVAMVFLVVEKRTGQCFTSMESGWKSRLTRSQGSQWS